MKLRNWQKITGALVLSGILFFGISSAAFADDATPTPEPTPVVVTPTPTATFSAVPPAPVTLYGVIAWRLGPLSTTTAPFADAQHVQASVIQTDTVDLNAMDAELPCGGIYQVDAYLDNDAYATLLAGGVLTNPSQPNPEPLAYGAPGVTGNPWKYVTTDACPVSTPTPTPTPRVVTPPVAPPTAPKLAYTGYTIPWPAITFWFAVLLAGIAGVWVDRKVIRKA